MRNVSPSIARPETRPRARPRMPSPCNEIKLFASLCSYLADDPPRRAAVAASSSSSVHAGLLGLDILRPPGPGISIFPPLLGARLRKTVLDASGLPGLGAWLDHHDLSAANSTLNSLENCRNCLLRCTERLILARGMCLDFAGGRFAHLCGPHGLRLGSSARRDWLP